MQKRAERIFVYGTLRQGFPLHRHIRRMAIRYVGKGKINGRLYDLGEFPGVFPSSSPADVITGEVYELTDPRRQLVELDRLEEFDPDREETSLFLRRRTLVRLRNGQRLRAWVYLMPRKNSKCRLIPGGDYAESHRPRS